VPLRLVGSEMCIRDRFGRLGPIVVATSIALRRTRRHFEYPKERPLIG
jgi:hypothetical protein